jgi:putative resolvase
VSSAAQPDLRTNDAFSKFCAARGVANVAFVEEVGGGLDLKRPKFVARMDCIEARQGRLSHKGRLVRFGFRWFEQFCAEHGTELLVAARQAMIFLDKIESERTRPYPSPASQEGAVKPGGSDKDRAT